MRLLVQAIVGRENAADHAAIPPGQEALGVGMREERILSRREHFALRDPQRWDPMRIEMVPLVGVVDEPAEIPPAADWNDIDRRW